MLNKLKIKNIKLMLSEPLKEKRQAKRKYLIGYAKMSMQEKQEPNKFRLNHNNTKNSPIKNL